MTAWRMAMRVGRGGKSIVERCVELGVAAITYEPFGETDFTEVPRDDAYAVTHDLKIAQKVSLRRLCYDMEAGDTIYVKEGSEIVAKGAIQGRKGSRAYRFNYARERIEDHNGYPWLQQVPVSWQQEFPRLRTSIGKAQQYAIEPVSAADAAKIEKEGASAVVALLLLSEPQEMLRLESYFRASAAAIKVIERRNNKLSNDFSAWLTAKHSVPSTRERSQIDVQFSLQGIAVLAELKICYGTGTRHAIREALGQLLEYNFYPGRTLRREWLIVIDDAPSDDDQKYAMALRNKTKLPLYLGWQCKGGFEFCPAWPG